MRFVRTAIGHRITSNSGAQLKLRLRRCCVVRTTAAGYVILEVKDERSREDLTKIDREISSKLHLPQGPWDAAHRTVILKLGRTCKLLLAGEAVGSRDDLLPGRQVESCEATLAGAFERGYVWAATEMSLGSVVSA